MNILALDDMHSRQVAFKQKFTGHTLISCFNLLEFKEVFSQLQYDLIFLDCDLADEHYGAEEHEHEDNGVAAVKWLLKQDCNQDTLYIIHSLNPDGSKLMYELLKDANYNVHKISFLELNRIKIDD